MITGACFNYNKPIDHPNITIKYTNTTPLQTILLDPDVHFVITNDSLEDCLLKEKNVLTTLVITEKLKNLATEKGVTITNQLDILIENVNKNLENKKLRVYDSNIDNAVKELYKKMRTNQTVASVTKMRQKYGNLTTPMKIWDCIDKLGDFIDISDPDVELPNLVHLFQTAEGIRGDGHPDWLQLTGFIHDLGKVIYLRGSDNDGTSVKEQYNIVGDTFVVGCRLPEKIVYPEFNKLNKDVDNSIYRTKYGIYRANCGLDNCLVAYGHDEYLYQVLVKNKGVKLPPEALYIIRYHSLYPWHTENEYSHLESSYDKNMKPKVVQFNSYDLYTKENTNYTEKQLKELREYYSRLIKKYLPETLYW